MEVTTTEELDFLSWMKKINERCTLIQLALIDRKDLTEEDYFLMEALHRVWHRGELPFYKTTLDLKEETTEQTGLFMPNEKINVNDDLAQ